MKILWVTNRITKTVAVHLGDNTETPSGGWIDGLFDQLSKVEGIDFCITFPHAEKLDGDGEGFTYHSFDYCPMNGISHSTISRLEDIIELEKPDIIHIFGTEFTHAYAAAQAAENKGMLSKVVINIQGIMTECAEHYTDGLPHFVVNRYTLKDFVSGNTVAHQKKVFAQRGQWEQKLLRKVQNVIGRTEFDKNFVLSVNPELKYYFCNETLRSAFYKDNWDYDNCEKHSVFISQASYPIKGLHCFLPAAAILKKKYPDLKVYVAGQKMMISGIADRLRSGSYKLYLNQLIKKFDLKDNVVFVGPLVCPRMKAQHLKSNVLVSPSVMENSPNSVAEAMLLGLPVVASKVGGVESMITDGREGLLYKYDDVTSLAECVDKIFSDEDLAITLSKNAIARAKETHSIETNNKTMLEIYNDLMNK